MNRRCFPTKRHWRGKSRIEDIESGLTALVGEINARGIRSIALPPLGSGLAGLDWTRVRTLIKQALADYPSVDVVVYEPGGGPADAFVNRSSDPPAMTPARAALVGLMRRYLAGMMDTSISLLEVQKLVYFLQEAGQPLRLRFVKAPYGPYAENLRHVLKAIEGHMVSGWREGDHPGSPVTIVPGADDEAEATLGTDPDVRGRYDRVSELVNGFETSFGLELLATAHWVAVREEAKSDSEVIRGVHAWHPRKERFSPDQIGIALAQLRGGGWLPTFVT